MGCGVKVLKGPNALLSNATFDVSNEEENDSSDMLLSLAYWWCYVIVFSILPCYVIVFSILHDLKWNERPLVVKYQKCRVFMRWVNKLNKLVNSQLSLVIHPISFGMSRHSTPLWKSQMRSLNSWKHKIRRYSKSSKTRLTIFPLKFAMLCMKVASGVLNIRMAQHKRLLSISSCHPGLISYL